MEANLNVPYAPEKSPPMLNYVTAGASVIHLHVRGDNGAMIGASCSRH